MPLDWSRQLGLEVGCLAGLPELSFIGPLVALQDRLDRLPAAKLAEHLERQTQEVRRELPPERVPAAASLRFQVGELLGPFLPVAASCDWLTRPDWALGAGSRRVSGDLDRASKAV